MANGEQVQPHFFVFFGNNNTSEKGLLLRSIFPNQVRQQTHSQSYHARSGYRRVTHDEFYLSSTRDMHPHNHLCSMEQTRLESMQCTLSDRWMHNYTTTQFILRQTCSGMRTRFAKNGSQSIMQSTEYVNLTRPSGFY